ncbi:MAG: N-acetyl-beta-hexosaminidase, partial [Lachnospiraceae bacterium]|nr:N-acetyl-beta-hexosaminidase [Lachnospiraceae bacterium]
LNTDWGDCGHVNYPAFSVPGMIYGACFSWSPEAIGFDEINQQISRLEYNDHSGAFVGQMAQIPNYSIFDWWAANICYEKFVLDHEPENDKLLPDGVKKAGAAEKADQKLCDIMRQMKQTAASMDAQNRPIVAEVDLAVEAIRIWNKVGTMLAAKESGETWDEAEACGLASRMERWFMAYKQQWRAVSREGDLHHIADIVFWYADCLRGRKVWG